MADFELLAPGGHQKLVDEVVDRLDLKADVDGYYSQMTVGAADNLTARGDATTAKFLYRTAGGTADIETGQAVAKSIKGNTLVWNHLVNAPTTSVTESGVTMTPNQDGSVTLNGTATGNSYFNVGNIATVSGHKYLMKGCPANGSASTYFLGIAGSATDTGSGGIQTGYTLNTSIRFSFKEGVTFDNVKAFLQCFDLTQMFGAGNEPTTVAEFEALFPLPYYAYDAGSLLSVNMTGIETVGFNLLDPAKVAALNGVTESTGVFSGNTSTIRGSMFTVGWEGVDYIPGMQYEASFKIETSTAANVNARPYFTYTDGTTSDGVIVAAGGTAYAISTAGKTISRVGLNFGNNNTLVFSQPCIHLVWSGRRNGEYEPFWSSQREIAASTYFPDGMRSAGTVRDELTSTEAITRVGVVDLGSLTWIKGNALTDGTGSVFYTQSQFLPVAGNFADAKLSKFTFNGSAAVSWESLTKGEYYSGNSWLVIGGDSALTITQFKESLNGVMLHYALATPTVTPIDPPLNLSYRVDDFGTERVMVPEEERSAPPVLDIAYGLNVVDFVRRAPTQYISAASFAQYLLARDAHDGTTTTMTWDDTDNRYEFAITDTVTEG